MFGHLHEASNQIDDTEELLSQPERSECMMRNRSKRMSIGIALLLITSILTLILTLAPGESTAQKKEFPFKAIKRSA